MKTDWQENGWQAEYYPPYLALTSPDGASGLVLMRRTKDGRNITLQQFRSSVASHGVTRACQTFWKLRAAQA